MSREIVNAASTNLFDKICGQKIFQNREKTLTTKGNNAMIGKLTCANRCSAPIWSVLTERGGVPVESLKGAAQKVVGSKQVLRGLKASTLSKVYIANDADTFLLYESLNIL